MPTTSLALNYDKMTDRTGTEILCAARRELWAAITAEKPRAL